MGDNIGATLQIAQTQADIRVALADAEKRRAMALAHEQEMVALTQEHRAAVVLAEARIPIALAGAFREANLSRQILADGSFGTTFPNSPILRSPFDTRS